MAQPFDITGQKFGLLTAISLVPHIERKSLRHNREWVCSCECGKTITVEQRLLLGKQYSQRSCGCIRVKEHFLATNLMGVDKDFVYQFADFNKYAFLHKQLTQVSGKNCSTYNIEDYKEDILYFYYQPQFNILYDYWKTQNKSATFYDLAKPSLDHIIPKSKNGSNHRDNLQFLTLFENLAKRDMTMEEWQTFKVEYHLTGDLFLETIINQKGGDAHYDEL